MNEDWHISIADDHAVLNNEGIVDVGLCLENRSVVSRGGCDLVNCSDDADAWPFVDHQ